MSKIYEPNNLIFTRQVTLLHKLSLKALEDFGEASFSLRQSTLLFNNTRIKFGFSTYYLFKFISSEFPKKEIGELSFLSKLSAAELSEFILLLGTKAQTPEAGHTELLQAMDTQGIKTILVEKLPPHELQDNPNQASKKIFFLSIAHLKEIFQEQDNKDARTPVLTTKRLMQSIFNHISENESFLYGLTNIKNFDEYTLNHSVNVCMLSISLGKKLGLDRNELVDLGLSSFFHDLGKLDIPKEILLKPGKLDDEELKIVQHHPHLGAEKLIQLKEFSYLPLSALNVAMEHHTREDESGYPRYTKKKNINLYSKIVKITDVFDAITTARPYRQKNFTREEALNFMLARSGKEFDPLLLKIFINMMGVCPVGTLVLLNTGEIGIVFENNPEPKFLLRPRVKLIADAEGNKIDGDTVDLTDMLPETQEYRRSIVKSLDPKKYNIPISDYFVSEAE